MPVIFAANSESPPAKTWYPVLPKRPQLSVLLSAGLRTSKIARNGTLAELLSFLLRAENFKTALLVPAGRVKALVILAEATGPPLVGRVNVVTLWLRPVKFVTMSPPLVAVDQPPEVNG